MGSSYRKAGVRMRGQVLRRCTTACSRRFIRLGMGVGVLVGVSAVSVAAVQAAATTTPAAAATCIKPKSGTWVGTWATTNYSGPGDAGSFASQLRFKQTAPGQGTVSGSIVVLGSEITDGGPVTGTVSCGVVTFGTVNGEITFVGPFSSPTAGSGTFSTPQGIVGDWASARATPHVTVAPPTGSPGSSITVTGSGFLAGENVAVSYKTNAHSPKTVELCSAVAAGDGSFNCAGSAPSGTTPDPQGRHRVTATGGTSGLVAKATFTIVT
jgi:hypothetical protein